MIPRGAEQFNLRLPDGLRERIKKVANSNMRSMNSEIVRILERALEAEQNEKGDVTA